MGQAVPGIDVAVIWTPRGSEVAPGQMGEICGARARPGDVPALLATSPRRRRESYGTTGCGPAIWGGCDAMGYFWYVSRDDDVITSAGYRIGPVEIENCLTGHPDVVMAAVVGMPDPVRTEVVKAFVVLRDGAEWDGLEAALIARVRERVSPHVAPRLIERVDALPMTATGKIMRRELRAGLSDGLRAPCHPTLRAASGPMRSARGYSLAAR